MIVVGRGIVDLDESPGCQGIIEKVSNGWVTINWSGGGRWGTPLDLVISSIQNHEWAFTDLWCSELIIPD